MEYLSAHEPSLRDRISWGVASLLGGDNRTRRNYINDRTKGILDIIPGVGEVVGAEEAGRNIGSGNTVEGIAGLSAAVLGVVPVVGDAAGVGLKKAVKAYHGSPHSFERFDMSKLGTGEGNQTFGHGLYFAEEENVAKDYRNRLSKGRLEFTDPKGQRTNVNALTPQHALEDYNMHGPASYPVQYALDEMRRGKSADEAIAAAKQDYGHFKPEELQTSEDTFRKMDPKITSEGHMYEVSLDAEHEDFMDFHKPLSEQSQAVRDKVYKAFGSDLDRLGKRGNSITGEGIYSLLKDPSRSGKISLSKTSEDAARASDTLKEAGIPGLKFQDAGSRGKEKGTYNFVVFDDRLINIVRQYGIAGAIGAGLITEEMARQMQAQGQI